MAICKQCGAKQGLFSPVLIDGVCQKCVHAETKKGLPKPTGDAAAKATSGTNSRGIPAGAVDGSALVDGVCDRSRRLTTHQSSSATVPIHPQSWNVIIPRFFGSFRIGDINATHLLAGPVSLNVSSDPTLQLVAKFDPPGTAVYAFVGSIISGFAAVAMLNALGGAIAPGWLAWYVIILFARRRDTAVDLLKADRIVVDTGNQRMAFRADIEGINQWIAFQMLDGFTDALVRVRTNVSAPVTEGKIGRPSMMPLLIMLVLLAAIAAAIGYIIISNAAY